MNIYLDMDGVIADFFTELARHYNVNHWKDLPEKNESVKALKGTDFFERLPKFPTSDELVEFIHELTNGNWYILSAPLRDDYDHSISLKRKWLANHGYTPKDAYFSSVKEKYAVNENGQSNILIDDREEKLKAWTQNHGIGILYQANKHSLKELKNLLERLHSFTNLTICSTMFTLPRNEKETIK